MFLLISLLLVGDYWDDYHECMGPCQVVASACYAPCEEVRRVCETPCNATINRAQALERLREFASCMNGPGDSGTWCVVRWDKRQGFTATCVTDLPHYCQAYDRDCDGDVDLYDYAKLELKR